ncbi:extracellular solute-binding protein [Massilia sp. DJPM01]|uniref:extracellular solute-binding protein n=1 Tax=Massilia sp. DJPM01 TaxID=3024404 RepID=UPI00259E5711|nr:extracellular solute-binding protein [Massilia sp. DJPM01]MDM5179614.1 extracellular solute-binding protein [Massilia sp. DJPM01]
MHRAYKLAQAAGPQAEQPTAEVIHWWTSGGESAAAQFNASMQLLDLVEQGMLNPVDEIAAKERWDTTLPAPIRDVIKVKGHYYAVALNVHMPTWIWYSRAAFKQAGIATEPATMDELFAALDKLKAAGLIALAHGGQSWQENIVFMAVLANVGGKDLYLSVLREREPRAIASEPSKSANGATIKPQKLLAGVMVAPATVAAFNRIKGSLPVRADLDASALDACAQAALAVMKDRTRHVGNGEVYLTPDQNGALVDVLSAYRNSAMPVEKAQKNIAAALKG